MNETLNLDLLPQNPGVYLMKDATGMIIYVGKAKNISKRVRQYFMPNRAGAHGWKIPIMIPLIKSIDFIVCASERDALILEDKLIKRYSPFFNTLGKDAKTYSFIKLTVQEDFPRVLFTRRVEKDGALYFGPYPKLSNVKSLLKFLWKSKQAALRPCKWSFSLTKPLEQKKITGCIYYHTGQCSAPCAGKISYPDYRAIVNRIKLFLEGDFGAMSKDLDLAMKDASKNMKYEEAAQYRDFLQALKHMRERIKVSEYKDNKLIKKMSASDKLKRLTEVLGADTIIRHIEAFDNSHLFGKEAVGGMVCFIDGEKYKAHYRRFKIKSENPQTGGDDFMMMKEIVSRRLEQIKKLPQKSRPDLLLIDGGKGQLSFALQAMQASGLNIRLIALAKDEEEIFTTDSKTSIKLDAADPARKLIMEIRDEVHRFAITYHRLLRNKKFLEDAKKQTK